jgi:creatinase
VTSRKLERGDVLSLNCVPMVAGCYYVALESTLFCETATDKNLRLWDINTEVHERGIELLKPGNKCSDVAKELNDIYERYRLLK